MRGGIQESWLSPKNHVLQAEEQRTPAKGKSSCCCKRPAWMKKAQILKGSIQEVEAEANDPGKTSRYYLSVQG